MRAPYRLIRWIATGALLGATVAGAIACSPASDPYAAFRQSSTQDIPGTFGYLLEPTTLQTPRDPARIYPDLIGASPERDVTLTLADVRNPGDGISWGPAWVFFTHDLCYFTAKGDFVSPSRAGAGDTCSHRQMLVQVVDARSGRLLGAFDAYDPNGGWRPAREDDAGAAQPPALTRFH